MRAKVSRTEARNGMGRKIGTPCYARWGSCDTYPSQLSATGGMMPIPAYTRSNAKGNPG